MLIRSTEKLNNMYMFFLNALKCFDGFYRHKIFQKPICKSFRLELVQATWAGTRAEIKTASDQGVHFCIGMSVRILG